MRRHWLLSTLCLATSPVWAAEQFDLVCSGTLETVTDVVSGLNVKNIKNQQPWSGRIQVDLDAKQYCFSAECPAASVIFDVAPDKIVFSPINALSGGGEYAEVSRVDGHFRRSFVRNMVTSTYRATCEKAPFTPFPKTRF